MKFNIIGFLLVFCCKLMHAYDCKVYDDKTRATAFGKRKLGDVVKQIPKKIRLPNCVVFDNDTADCEFIDTDQVSYLVNGNTIIKKTINNVHSHRGRLPLGLFSSDTILTVLEKSRKLPEKFPLWFAFATDKRTFMLSTGTCLGKSDADAYALNLFFDAQGKILSISMQYEPN